MSPTVDTALISHHTRVSLTSVSQHSQNRTMRDTGTMSEDTSLNNGFSESENISEQRRKSNYDFHFKEPCLYTHKIFINAAKVFNSLKQISKEELESPFYRHQQDESINKSVSKLSIQDLEFDNDNEKRLMFELAFETLKYQRVFEDLLQDCSFFSTFSECKEDEALVYVILCDYQNRRFQQRVPFPGETLNAIVQSVEDAIVEYRTKLNASLAKNRIKSSAPSIKFLLPDKVRSKEEIQSKLPVYVWVNELKTTLDSVISLFKTDHYALVTPDDLLENQVMYVDQHCSDVLVFPPESRAFILGHDLLQNGYIVLQDKSSCIAPHTIKYLIGDDDDVIHVNAGSGVTTAHISSLMSKSSGHVLAYGTVQGLMQKTVDKYGAKSLRSFIHYLGEGASAGKYIKIQLEPFLDIDLDDNKFKNVKVVLVTADCSKSAISNPIDFVVNEGEDMKILKYLSQGEADDTKLGELIANHVTLLKQAMKLSKVQAVVYMTRSIIEAENENVVTRAIEYTNMVQQRKFPYRVVPPVLPFSGKDIEKGNGIIGKFIKFKPSDRNSGCFVAVITREPENMKETNKDIIERACGLLGGKKKSKKSETDVEKNGDVDKEEEKLLEKRIKRSPRKLRSTHSHPAVFATYVKSSAINVGNSQTNNGPKVGHQVTKSLDVLTHKSRTKICPVALLAEPSEKKEKTVKVAEHVKVVKHPAPFSFSSL